MFWHAYPYDPERHSLSHVQVILLPQASRCRKVCRIQEHLQRPYLVSAAEIHKPPDTCDLLQREHQFSCQFLVKLASFLTIKPTLCWHHQKSIYGTTGGFLQAECPSRCPTTSIKTLKGTRNTDPNHGNHPLASSFLIRHRIPKVTGIGPFTLAFRCQYT